MVIRNDTEGLLSCLQGEMEEEGGSREHSQRGRGVCDKGGQQWALHTTQSHEFMTEHKLVGKSLLEVRFGLKKQVLSPGRRRRECRARAHEG